MIGWLAPAVAALFGLFEIVRRYEARLDYYLGVWRQLVLQAVVNGAASAAVVAILHANSKLGGGSVLIIAGVGGPAVLRTRLIDWQKRSIRSTDDERASALSASTAVGPAAIYDWFLARIDRRLWNADRERRGLPPRSATWATGDHRYSHLTVASEPAAA